MIEEYLLKLHYIIWALLAWLITGTAMAAGADTGNRHQSHDSIRQAAGQYAQQLAMQQADNQNITIDVNRLDRRLKLAQCDRELEAFSSPNTKSHGRTTVGVRCNGSKTWKLYVSVDIQVIKPVVILSKPVTRNTELQLADLKVVNKNIATLHRGFYSSIEEVQGMLTKNPMKSGTVLTPGHVKKRMTVKKGALVTILANASGFQVRMKGKAMKSGGTGDWITVQNISSNRKVEGRILNSGVILVTL